MHNNELEIRNLILSGFKIADIAQKLNIKPGTVKFHLTKIYKREKVSGRSELMAVNTKQVQEKLNEQDWVTTLKTDVDILKKQNRDLSAAIDNLKNSIVALKAIL
ncbi:MAG: helix-turn-helix transcriptional regulator [Bdellovibrionales bacterium]|nr:helix-turn-helix transcriptional regulator [Bdellovibrionales bacterium]